MRAPLDVVPSARTEAAVKRDDQVRPQVEQYQGRYKARHDERAGPQPSWRAGDWVRVRHPVTGKLEGKWSFRIESQTAR